METVISNFLSFFLFKMIGNCLGFRYKQYTRNDIMSAIEEVKNGMSALQASRKYGVPSRTLYDKVKKMGITTGRQVQRKSLPDYPSQFPGALGRVSLFKLSFKKMPYNSLRKMSIVAKSTRQATAEIEDQSLLAPLLAV